MKNVDMKFKNLEEVVLKLKDVVEEMFTLEEKEGKFIVWSEYRANEGKEDEYGYGNEQYKIGSYEECIEVYISYIQDRIIADDVFLHLDIIIEEDLGEGFYIKKDDLEIITETFC